MRLTLLSAEREAPTPAGALALNLSPASPSGARCDLGQIVTGLSPQVPFHCGMRNDTQRPVTLTQVMTSSGCLRAALGDDPLPVPGKAGTVAVHVLPAGGRISLRAVFDGRALPSGQVTQDVWVLAKGQGAPVATLHLTATVAPELAVVPRSLDFGRVGLTDRPSLSLNVTLNPRLRPGAARVRFSCADAEVHVTAQPVSAGPGLVYRVTLIPSGPAHQVHSRLVMTITGGGDGVNGGNDPGAAPTAQPGRTSGDELVLLPVSADVTGPTPAPKSAG